ncbi:cytosolic protein [Bacillus spongiae]|uniref:Cytosolic protein n=1 Tax=Bacillus spongiae TaxID=2683610 RepID=A0ABU8H8G4_9BACI
MAGLKTLFIRFSQECETSDMHQDQELQTQYYKASFDKVMSIVEELFSSKEYKIQSVSKDHGEISVGKSGKLFIVATVLTVQPFETAVDFKVTADKTVITGAYPRLKTEILSYYRKLNQQLTPVKK